MLDKYRPLGHFLQHHRHMGHGTHRHVVDAVGIQIRAIALLLRAVIFPVAGKRIVVPLAGGQLPVGVLFPLYILLDVDLRRAVQRRHLVIGQVVEHGLREAQLQQLLPEGCILGRVLPGLPVRGIALAQERGQQDGRQQQPQAAPQHRPARQAHRRCRDDVAGVRQGAGQLGHAPQNDDIDDQQRHDQQPSLQPDIGQGQ